MKSFRVHLFETFFDAKKIKSQTSVDYDEFTQENYFELFRNPTETELKSVQRNKMSRGFINPDGDLFVWNVGLFHILAFENFNLGTTYDAVRSGKYSNGILVEIKENMVFLAQGQDKVNAVTENTINIIFDKCRKKNPNFYFYSKGL